MAFDRETREANATLEASIRAHGGSAVLVPLPQDKTALLALRKKPPVRVLNDYVEQAFVAMWGDPDHARFSKCMEACYASEAVEGTLVADDHAAAELMRAYAVAKSIPMLATAKTATIVTSLRVIQRRYGLGRSERRERLHGAQLSMLPPAGLDDSGES